MAFLAATVRGPAATLAPQNPVRAILSAFDRVPVVALGSALHGSQVEDDFALELVRDPHFIESVSNVAIECGNSRYQALLDGYVAGAAVPLDQVQRVWRNTTQVFGCNALEQQRFIVAIRELNRHRAVDRRLRVLAGDPPIDWTTVRSDADVKPFLALRDTNFASVVEHQVLAKHKKALLLIGDFHVLRHRSAYGPSPTITMLLESKHPHSTYVIIPHTGFGDRNGELEPRLATWPTPSIATVRDTWLGMLDPLLIYNDSILASNASKVVNAFPGRKLEDLADAYLYLGSLASIDKVKLPEDTDPAYARILARRRRLMGGGSMRVVPAPTQTR